MTALQRANGGALARPPLSASPFTLLDEMLRDFGNVGFARVSGVFDDDVEENDDAYVITCDVPGVDAKDIELSVEGDTVSVRAERKSARNTTVIEHSYTVSGIDAANAEAHCEKGVLTITLPKSAAAKKRVIPVRLRQGDDEPKQLAESSTKESAG